MQEELYEIQRYLVQEMPEEGTNVRKALDIVDQLIDELQADDEAPYSYPPQG